MAESSFKMAEASFKRSRNVVKGAIGAPMAAASACRRRLMPAHNMGQIASQCKYENDMNTPQAVSIASLLAAEDKQSGKDQLQHQLHNINDEDESAAREFEENLWKYSRLLLERGRFKQRWDPFIQLLVVYNSIFIPMSLAFAYQLAPNHQIADYCIDVLFIVDMVVSISTVYYNQHFELVIDRKQIVKHYLSTWFTIDLFSILPLELFANLVRDDEATRILVADFLKLPRMLRLARFRKRASDQTKSGANLLRMVILCVLFIFLAHLVACLWWSIGRMGLPGADVGTDDHSTSWILRMEARDRTQLLARNATAEGAFLAILADDDAGDAAALAEAMRGSDGGALEAWHADGAQALIPGQYLTSLYWALNALLKTPSIGPDTPLEKSFVTIVTIFGVLVFTIFVGNTIEVLQAVSHTDEARNKQMKMLTDFVHTARISRSLRSRIFAHSAAEYRSTLGINTSQLLHQFPRALRGQIVMYMHRQTLEACDLFGLITTECAKALLLCVTPTVCLQKEVLVGRGELCEYLYILQRGALQVRDQDASDFEEAKADDAKDNFELTRQVYRKVKRMSCQALYNIGLPVPPPSAAPPRAQRRAPIPSQRRGNSPSGRKGRPEFHVLERPGALVGLRDVRELSMIYPYTVVASKTATLMRITATDMGAVLSAFGGEDEEAACAQLLKEFDVIAASMLHGSKKQRRASVDQLQSQLGGSFCKKGARDVKSPSPTAVRPVSPVEAQAAAASMALARAAQKSVYISGDDDDAADAAGTGSCGVSAGGTSIEHQPHGNQGALSRPLPNGGQCGFVPVPGNDGLGGETGARNGAGGSETITGAKPELATQAERKNSLALVGADGIVADAFTGGAAACASGSSKDAERREQEQRQWQAQMSEVRQDVASAGRKLQSLMSTLSAVESELAFIPHVSEALQALEAIASGKDGPRLHIAGEQPATRGSSEAVVDSRHPREGGFFGWFRSPIAPPPASVPPSPAAAEVDPTMRRRSRHRQSARDGDDEWSGSAILPPVPPPASMPPSPAAAEVEPATRRSRNRLSRPSRMSRTQSASTPTSRESGTRTGKRVVFSVRRSTAGNASRSSPDAASATTLIPSDDSRRDPSAIHPLQA